MRDMEKCMDIYWSYLDDLEIWRKRLIQRNTFGRGGRRPSEHQLDFDFFRSLLACFPVFCSGMALLSSHHLTLPYLDRCSSLSLPPLSPPHISQRSNTLERCDMTMGEVCGSGLFNDSLSLSLSAPLNSLLKFPILSSPHVPC